jgi:hypothetical protein
LANASVSGGVLSKLTGCDGCSDAGAASQQQISNNGYLEFTANVQDRLRFVGLTGTNSDNSPADIDYAFRLQGTVVEVRENGSYRWDLSIAEGDKLRIAVVDGVVSYAKNGNTFYTSKAAPTGDLRADTSLLSLGSLVSNAVIAAATSATSTAATREEFAYWALESGTTQTADSSGAGYTGTVLGNPAWGAGVVGNAVVLDGSGDMIQVPHASAFNSYPLSISLWVKTSASGLHGLVNKYAPGSLEGYQVFINNGALCAWYFRNSTNYIWNSSRPRTPSARSGNSAGPTVP